MVDRLASRRIIVTGATGIAAAGARLFATEGAVVGIVARDTARCAELADTINVAGGRATWAVADLRDDGATVAAFAALAEDLGGPADGLFAVAGGSGRRAGDGALHDIPLDGWRETLDLNGAPAFLAAREAIRGMRGPIGRGGSVVVVTSVLATDPVPSLFATHAYAAIKGAEEAFVRSIAAYYAAEGIRVNAIAPGLVATPMSARAQSDPVTAAFVTIKQPLAGGFIEAEAVAQAALFLLSDDARMITGQRLAVDGGWSVTAAGREVV